jgi:3D (Asp-Asp-Asp) domain-containing protein
MKIIIMFLSYLVMSCSYATTSKSPEVEVYTARITYYSTDKKWGNRVACQSSKRAKEGVTVAAHPNFKFGTKLYIPGLKNSVGSSNFIVQDRGGAVTSKKASRGKAYVFDIYVTSHWKISKFAYSQPEYMKVYVQKP